MAQAVFSVDYRGPGLDSGEIPVRDLAPSLLALSDLIERVNLLANGQESHVSLNLKSTERGSFGAELVVVFSEMANATIDFMTEDSVRALSTLLALTGIRGVPGLLQLIKIWPHRIETKPVEDGSGKLEISYADGGDVSKVVIDGPMLNVLRDRRAREAAKDMIEPLAKQGIDEISVSKARIGDEPDPDVPKEPAVVITKEDRASFDVPDAIPEELAVDESVRIFALANVAFRTENKWRLSDGHTTIYVEMADESFLAKVEAGLAFHSDDLLKVRLRTRQYRDHEGAFRSEYTVVEVLQHMPHGGSIDLFDPTRQDSDAG